VSEYHARKLISHKFEKVLQELAEEEKFEDAETINKMLE